MKRSTWLSMLFAAMLGGCDAVPGNQSDPVNTEMGRDEVHAVGSPAREPQRPLVAAPAETSVRSCTAEIGAAAAARRAAVCRDVSPATRPPCNAANSCALIEDEIARSCALFADGGEPAMAGCGPPPGSGDAAAAVVRRYYAAIDARDYETAWRQWGDDGRPGESFAGFRRGFADTASTRVTIGALASSEGAAGSVYQTVPVTVDAALCDGTRQRFRGSYVVRRVAEVDGASTAQRRWHLESARLRPVPPG